MPTATTGFAAGIDCTTELVERRLGLNKQLPGFP